MTCTHCGADLPEEGNFCPKCSGKLREVCGCWVKEKPYNCGQDKCPGYQLIVDEIRESKAKQLSGFGTSMGEQELK